MSDKLEQLCLDIKILISIPEGVYDLFNLKELTYFNQIQRFDNRLETFKNREVFYLSNNRLISLPDSIGSLPNMRNFTCPPTDLATCLKG